MLPSESISRSLKLVILRGKSVASTNRSTLPFASMRHTNPMLSETKRWSRHHLIPCGSSRPVAKRRSLPASRMLMYPSFAFSYSPVSLT